MGEYSGYKRPRMEAYGGMDMMGPSPSYGMGDYGMGGGMMGMGMGPPFPCVKLRGLPFDVSDEDIRMFLGVEPVDALLVRRDGRLSGEAFVVCSNVMHVEMALSKNRSYLGRRYIEIYPAKKSDYYRAVCAEVMEGGSGMPRGGGGGMPYRGGGGDYGPPGVAAPSGGGGGGMDAGTTILKLRGLPFSVSDDDICAWFNDDTTLGLSPVVKDNVLIVMDNGRPSGVAFVEFPTPQEATTAMGKNKQMMGSRYVEMFPANRADLERYKARGGF